MRSSTEQMADLLAKLRGITFEAALKIVVESPRVSVKSGVGH